MIILLRYKTFGQESNIFKLLINEKLYMKLLVFLNKLKQFYDLVGKSFEKYIIFIINYTILFIII